MTKHQWDAVGRHFDRLQGPDGLPLWYAARTLLWIYAGGHIARLSQAKIGNRLGRSKARVSRAIGAARAWPQRPRTAAERIDFVALFHGNTSRAVAATQSPEVRVQQAWRRFRRSAAALLALGCPPREIRSSLEGLLCGAPNPQAEPEKRPSAGEDGGEPG